MASSTCAADPSERILEALRKSDVQGAGSIRVSELRATIQFLDGKQWTDDRADAVLRALDKDGCGFIRHEEFLSWLGTGHTASADKLPEREVDSKLGMFSVHEGFISKGGDLLVANLTLEDAKLKCQEIKGCRGFTFKGASADGSVEVRFKNKWDLQGTGWTSYMLQEGPSDSNRKAWITSVKNAGTSFAASKLRLLPFEARNDREVVLEAVRQEACAFQHASDALRSSKDFVAQAVQCQADALRWAANTLRNDSDVVMAAVARDGKALQYALELPRADRAVVLKSVGQVGTMLVFASESLKEDTEVVVAAFQQLNVPGVSSSQSVRDIYLAAVRRLGIWLELAPESLKADSLVVCEAFRQLKVPDIKETLSVKELYTAALKKYGRCLLFAPSSLKADKTFVLSVVSEQGWLLEFACEELRSDGEVIRAALRQLKVPGISDSMSITDLYLAAGKASAEYASWSPLATKPQDVAV